MIPPEFINHLLEAVDVLPDSRLVDDRVQAALALADELSILEPLAGFRAALVPDDGS